MNEEIDWENLSIIGKGGSSIVYKSMIKNTKELVAIKKIDIEGLNKNQLDNIISEINTLKSLAHENIISFHGMKQNTGSIFILLEYASKGSLRQYYQTNGPLSVEHISYCLKDILRGLHYLHSNDIAHRDIKCANCLISNEFSIKLADFGASKKLESESIVSGLKGTPHWMAPEVIKGTEKITGWMKADVWSIGCTMVEMLNGKIPYSEFQNPMTAMYKIANGELPILCINNETINLMNYHNEDIDKIESKGLSLLIKMLLLCCEIDPQKRSDVDQLLGHEFLDFSKNLDPCILFVKTESFSENLLNGTSPTDNSLVINTDENKVDEIGLNDKMNQFNSMEFSKRLSNESSIDTKTPSLNVPNIPSLIRTFSDMNCETFDKSKVQNDSSQLACADRSIDSLDGTGANADTNFETANQKFHELKSKYFPDESNHLTSTSKDDGIQINNQKATSLEFDGFRPNAPLSGEKIKYFEQGYEEKLSNFKPLITQEQLEVRNPRVPKVPITKNVAKKSKAHHSLKPIKRNIYSTKGPESYLIRYMKEKSDVQAFRSRSASTSLTIDTEGSHKVERFKPTSLPPLKHASISERDDFNVNEAGTKGRFIHSAPAVSRSVMLPPILGSQTPQKPSKIPILVRKPK